MSGQSSSGALLDVDESLLGRRLLLEESEQGFSFHLPSASTQPSFKNCPVKTVRPIPGLCVKTRTESGDKFFINICHTDAIPLPDEVTEERLIEILGSSDPSAFRVPMSLGERHDELDKSGSPCVAYDVAINTDYFFKSVQNSQVISSFLITAAMEGLEDKYNLNISKADFIILKNRKSLGTIKEHNILQRQQLVKEMVRDEKPKTKEQKTLIAEVNPGDEIPTSKQSNQSEYQITREPLNGNCVGLVAKVKLPDVISTQNLTLDVGEDRVVLEEKTCGCLLDIFLPHLISQESCKARFNKKLKVLTVTMPLLKA